jgi:hypothetical protein
MYKFFRGAPRKKLLGPKVFIRRLPLDYLLIFLGVIKKSSDFFITLPVFIVYICLYVANIFVLELEAVIKPRTVRYVLFGYMAVIAIFNNLYSIIEFFNSF